MPLAITSPFDATRQQGVLRLPPRRTAQPLPLVYAPHPFGWTVDEDYHGGCAGLRATGHAGWLDVPADLGVAVLQPMGHHRAVPGCSLGYPATVADVPAWIEAAGEYAEVDADRLYACGLSMGGQESLLAAGRHPGLFAGVFVFNPVVDVVAWHEDLVATDIGALRAERNDTAIETEVGGLPADVPDLYAERDALGVASSLARIPLAIWWSAVDGVVPRQAERHGKRLYDVLKAADPGASVTEYEHTRRYRVDSEPTEDERWAIHETADYRFATRWLLLHRRGGLRVTAGTGPERHASGRPQ